MDSKRLKMCYFSVLWKIWINVTKIIFYFNLEMSRKLYFYFYKKNPQKYESININFMISKNYNLLNTSVNLSLFPRLGHLFDPEAS